MLPLTPDQEGGGMFMGRNLNSIPVSLLASVCRFGGQPWLLLLQFERTAGCVTSPLVRDSLILLSSLGLGQRISLSV